MGGRYSRTLATLFLLALGAPVAQAMTLENGIYFEIGVGKAEFKDANQVDLDQLTRDFFDSYELPVQSLTSTFSNKDRSYSLLTGYRFNPWIALEAGFFRLGAFQYGSAGTVSDEGTIRPDSFWFSYRAKGFLFGGSAMLPLGPFLELRGRAGLTNTDTRVRIAANVEGSAVKNSFTESSNDFYYGVGLGMKVFEYYRLGVDWMHHRGIGKPGGNGATDVDNLQVSFSYQY